MTPVAMRSQYSHLFGSSALPVLEEIFRLEYERYPMLREQLCKVVTTDRDIWQSSEIHDIELFQQVAEGTDYSFVRSKQGASKTLQIQKWGLGVSISREAVEDGKFDLLGEMVRKLARSGKESQEISAMNLFNNGFTSVTTADGLALFHTAHTLPSGLTFRSRLSSDSDLSPTTLDQALQDFGSFSGDSGIFYNLMPKTLLVAEASTNKRYALELLGSDLKADTAENNMNPFKQEGLRSVSSPHLTDPDAWFLLASPEDTGLRIVQREAMQTMAAGPDVGFKSDSILYKSRYREQVGAIHAYGVIGTPGA